MIKEIFGFIQWQWSKLETWQKFWIFAMFIVGMAAGAPKPYDHYLFLLAMSILVGMVVVGLMIPSVKSSWEKYKKEKYGLFETIKDSDQ